MDFKDAIKLRKLTLLKSDDRTKWMLLMGYHDGPELWIVQLIKNFILVLWVDFL